VIMSLKRRVSKITGHTPTCNPLVIMSLKRTIFLIHRTHTHTYPTHGNVPEADKWDTHMLTRTLLMIMSLTRTSFSSHVTVTHPHTIFGDFREVSDRDFNTITKKARGEANLHIRHSYPGPTIEKGSFIRFQKKCPGGNKEARTGGSNADRGHRNLKTSRKQYTDSTMHCVSCGLKKAQESDSHTPTTKTPGPT